MLIHNVRTVEYGTKSCPNEGLTNFRIYCACIFTACLIFAGCTEAEKVNSSNEIGTIEEMSAARAEAFRQGDAAAIAAYFTEDGVLMAPGVPATAGRAAVEAYYQQIFNEFEAGLESHYVDVQISGNLAYGQGFARVILVPHEGGETIISTAKYINILKRQPDGTWLTSHDIWNGNE